jgi:hypothetical protein
VTVPRAARGSAGTAGSHTWSLNVQPAPASPSSTTGGRSQQSGCAAASPSVLRGRSWTAVLTRTARARIYLRGTRYLPGNSAVLSALRVLAIAVQLRHRTRTCAIITAVFGAGPRVALAALVCTLACSALLCHLVLLYGSWDLRAQTSCGDATLGPEHLNGRCAFILRRSRLSTAGLTADVHSGRRLVHSLGYCGPGTCVLSHAHGPG